MSRLEVSQHALAFQNIIQEFVIKNNPLSENLIKSTHAILVHGLSASEAGVISSQSFGGIYRHGNQKAYAGDYQFLRPAAVPKAMASMVESMSKSFVDLGSNGGDPFILAAKFCDRFVNIHPFRDGNGRLCRLILNAILLKYAGIVVTLGENEDARDEYLFIAAESGRVGGHAGQLGKLVLEAAERSYGRILSGLARVKRRSCK
jgi:Fic family protein